MIDFKKYSKEELFNLAKDLSIIFCKVNNLEVPKIRWVEQIAHASNRWQATGLYYDGNIQVSSKKSAKIGSGFRQWSFPGYKVDRTPFGVVFHELGHYVSDMNGLRRIGEFKLLWKSIVASTKAISNYEPNIEESFAESFRLFMSNPDYLKRYSIERYNFISEFLGLKPIEKRNYLDVLKERGADERWLIAAINSIKIK